MDGSSFLGPLALLGCSVVVAVLAYVAIHYLKLGTRAKVVLRYLRAFPLSTLPAPASSSASSLTLSLGRKLKAAKSAAVKNAPHLTLPDAPRWSSPIDFLARKWRNRVMPEQLPTTVSSDVPPDHKKRPIPVLVGLGEASTVSSPSIPLRMLSAACPPSRSSTPTLVSISTTPALAAASSSSTIDMPPLPATPPPFRGMIESLSTPKGKATELGYDYPLAQRTHNLIYPPSRPRTPSPRAQNPHFLSTSPVRLLGNHRRTRSLGGISLKKIAAAPTFESAYGSELGMRITSRSTEMLIALEDGVEGHGDRRDDVFNGRSETFTAHVDPTPTFGEREKEDAVEFPTVDTNNAWRHWDDDDKLLALDPDDFPFLLPITAPDVASAHQGEPNPPSFNDDDFLHDISYSNIAQDIFDDPFNEDFETVPIPDSPSPSLSNKENPAIQEPVEEDEEDVTKSDKVDPTLEEDPVPSVPTSEIDAAKVSEPQAPLQMPTPPASPAIQLLGLRIPSAFEVETLERECVSIYVSPVDDLGCEVGTLEREDPGAHEGPVDEVVGCAAEEEHFSTDDKFVASLVEEEDLSADEAHDEHIDEVVEGPEDDEHVSTDETHEDLIDEVVGWNEEEESDDDDDDDYLADDPPLPEFGSPAGTHMLEIGHAEDINSSAGSAAANVLASTGQVEDMDPSAVSTAVDVDPLAEEDVQDPVRCRPAWSLRASEASKLGIIVEKPTDTPQIDESVPGAFPETSTAKATTSSAVATADTKPIPGRHPALSFAATVASLRRRAQPLDIALAMQMRPGLGAGADPAWMVRFMMAVFGWVVVAVSAGIE